jgi:hypothetical protein
MAPPVRRPPFSFRKIPLLLPKVPVMLFLNQRLPKPFRRPASRCPRLPIPDKAPLARIPLRVIRIP